MKKTYLSRQGYEKLKEELQYLREVKKPEISERLGVAADHGDLSENFEYDAAKEALTQVMMKIRDITVKLSNAEIIDDVELPSDKVYVGAKVVLEDKDTGDTDEYILVGSDEVDPLEGKISVESPIAQGLLGHSVGDAVDIKIPSGTISYKIIEITRE